MDSNRDGGPALIDRSRYEGHTKGPWHVNGSCLSSRDGLEIARLSISPAVPEDAPNHHLLSDAPMLVVEIDRLASDNARLTAERDQLKAALMEFVDAYADEADDDGGIRLDGDALTTHKLALNARVINAWESARRALNPAEGSNG